MIDSDRGSAETLSKLEGLSALLGQKPKLACSG